MACPTKEEYEDALKRKGYLRESIDFENRHREKLLNELCTSQSCLNSYKALLSDVDMIILEYKLYQELLEESGEKK